MDDRYCLAFDGRVADGFAVEQVRDNLAALLHLKDHQIERLFGGTPVVVKRNLDKGQAIKYRNMLAKTGALLLIRPDATPPAEVQADGSADRLASRSTANRADDPSQDSVPNPVHSSSAETAAAVVIAAAATATTTAVAERVAPLESTAAIAKGVDDMPTGAVESASARATAPDDAPASDVLDCPRCGHRQPSAQQCAVCKMDLRLHIQRLAKRARLRVARR